MKTGKFVTFLAGTVLSLVSSFFTVAHAAAAAPSSNNKTQVNKTVMSADQLLKPAPTPEEPFFMGSFVVQRGTSLVNFKDGSKSDTLDYMLAPAFKMSYGTISTAITYSQNLHETDVSSSQKSDWGDVPVSFTFNSYKWIISSPLQMAITPSLTAIIPVSEVSTKRDQLQTTTLGKISFVLSEQDLKAKHDGAWNAGFGLTAGRNFHAYQENINGDILTQYFSNQSLSLGYTYKKVSTSIEYVHRSRWSYYGNTKDSFDLAEEVGYSFNDHFSMALGHTNSGAGLKDNGTDSNFSVLNENTSVVYVSMAVGF